MPSRCSQSIFYSQRHRRSSPFHSNLELSSHAFSIQGRAFPFSPSKGGLLSLLSLLFLRLQKKNPFKHQGVCSQHAPRTVLLAGLKSLSLPPSFYLRITHQNTPEPSGPRRLNSLSNICTHLSITPPVSSIPFSQHQKRRHDSFKTGFAYCQWGTGSRLPLWRPVWLSSLPEFRQ
ncbi:hypothetical protein TNCV_3051971 [Trichonephila clavipes]|nr:hypothetical protein TNCV_3051971 [Trichonephila clavipes]